MTKRQKQILKTIKRIAKRQGRCSVIDVASAEGITESSVRYFIQKLEEEGFITYFPRQLESNIVPK